jgi:hypothetical protein
MYCVISRISLVSLMREGEEGDRRTDLLEPRPALVVEDDTIVAERPAVHLCGPFSRAPGAE